MYDYTEEPVRKVEERLSDGSFKEITWQDIKDGMVVRLTEPDGTEVGVFTAVSDSYEGKQAWKFDVEMPAADEIASVKDTNQ